MALRKYAYLSILTAFLAAGGHAAVKPVRIVAGYHETGAAYFTCRARFGTFYQLFYPRGKSGKSAIRSDELDRYSIVAIARNGSIEGDDLPEALAEFLKKGGTLLLSGRPAAQLLPLVLPGATYVSFPSPVPVTFTPAGEELAKGADRTLILSTDGVRVPSGGESLATAGDASAIFEARIGQGRVLFVGEHLFPPFGTVDENAMFRALKAPVQSALDTLNNNLFARLNAPPAGEAISSWLKETKNSRAMSVWFRDFDQQPFEGAEHLDPPVPLNGEFVGELPLEMGVNETERRIFYTTTSAPAMQFSCRVSPLKSASGSIPESQVSILAMERPSDTFVGPTVYFGSLPDISGNENATLAFNGPRTVTWCLRVNSRDMRPGDYRGNVEFFDGARKLAAIPVSVKIWPVSLYKRWVNFSAEIFTYFHYLKDEKARTGFADKARDWRQHFVDFGLGGFSTYSAPAGRVRATGSPFTKAVEENPAAFRGPNPPRLEMGEEADTFFNILMNEGVTQYRGYHLCGPPIEAFLPLAKKVHGKENLTADSPETLALAQYWFSEFGRYVREKGYTDTWTKIMDEWGPEDVEPFLRYARIAQGAGWKVTGNPGLESVLSNRTLRNRVWDSIDMWWYAWNPVFLRIAEMMKERGKPVDPENGLWGTQTSSWWWNHSAYNLMNYTWGLSLNGFKGLHWHGWSRGNPNSAGVWLEMKNGRERIFPSIAYEMMAEGLEEGQYIQMLREIDPKGSAGTIAGLIGEKAPLAAKEWKIGEYEMTVLDENTNKSFAAFRTAKKSLLAAIVETGGKNPGTRDSTGEKPFSWKTENPSSLSCTERTRKKAEDLWRVCNDCAARSPALPGKRSPRRETSYSSARAMNPSSWRP